MKTLFIVISLLATGSLSAKSFSFMPSGKKNYVKAVTNQIPSYQTGTKSLAAKYIPVAQKIAFELSMSPELIISVIWTESHFKASAKSKVGAKGLMQIMPKTRKQLIKEMKNYNQVVTKYLSSTELSYQELEDIILGSYYLNKLNKKFNNADHAIVAYNMGPSWVTKRLANKKAVGVKNDYLSKVKTKIQIIALAE